MLETDLVHWVENTGDRPVTHAIVFGIGTYPYGREISALASLENLKSPVQTARAIADWLILNYDNPLRPLASVSLIVSSDESFVYRNPKTGTDYVVPKGTTQDFKDRVGAWAERAMANFENGSIFYYCGHGLSSGYLDCMLTRSFGENSLQHLEGVFERSSVVNAMRSFGPRYQLFVFDTCRYEAEELLAGGSLLPPLLHARPGAVAAGGVHQCRFYAAADGQKAFGEREGVSLFSGAFISASRSAGRKLRREWWLSSCTLLQHLGRFMPADQVPHMEGPVFDICRIGQTVSVPVIVCCDPGDDIYRVRLEMRSEAGESHMFDGGTELETASWSISLATGSYVFGVSACNLGEFATIEGHSVTVYPPYTDIIVDVAQGTVC